MKAARALPVLMYHHVSPAPGLVTVSPATFAGHMRALAARGWRAVGTADFERFLAGEPLPAKSVMITFDDGYLDNWVHAHPILAETGMKAVVFAVTGWLGDGPARAKAGEPGAPATPEHKACMAAVREGRADRAMLRWSEAAAMQEAGTAEFHSHTHTHTRWDQKMPRGAERDAALAADLAASRGALAARLGGATRHLCWPQGYYDDDYRRVAREAGFRVFYTTEKGVNRPGADPERIGRIVTKERDGAWLASRVRIYASPVLGRLYTLLRGQR
ncbi:MAG: polysaccharide deacetylase family protein [Burkholderiales bacterium]|nr:polysaccharide deacetylase family protein [Burkholderiales bacterium]